MFSKKRVIFSSIFVLIVIGITLGLYFGLRKNSRLRMIGYYKETATGFRCPGIPEMTPDRIPHQYYTHLVYCFSPGVNTQTWTLENADEKEVLRYTLFNNLKDHHPGLKTMMSLGGDLASTAPMSRMAANDTGRRIYVKHVIEFVQKHGFDGIDVDWEYPGDVARGGSVEDDVSFVKFVKDLREATKRAGLILSVALPGGSFWGKWYRVSEVADYVDWFNIMAYNVLGVWDDVTNCSSPLENPLNPDHESIVNAVNYFTKNVSPSKFNLGVSLWGIVYKLKSPSHNVGIGTPSYLGPEANAGWCTKQKGYLAYFEITQILEKERSIVKEDTKQVCKYFTYDGDQWVAYDDVDTYTKKIDFAVKRGLGGVSVWGVDADIPEKWPLTKGLFSNV